MEYEDAPDPPEAAPPSSDRRTLLVACLACALGAVLLTSALGVLRRGHRSCRARCPAAASWRPSVVPSRLAAPSATDSPLPRVRPGFRPLLSDGEMPPRAVRVDFEHTPRGRAILPGEDLGTVFLPLGLSLSTSIDSSYVGADSYVVDGRSRGNSAATVRPRWEGLLRLAFSLPGRPQQSLGVHRFGLAIAHVFPGGTRIEALDADGRVVGTVSTSRSGSDFLGFASTTPIHAVLVVPNAAIDANYAIDDVVFDRAPL